MSGSRVWRRPVSAGVNQSPFHSSLIFISGLESPPRTWTGAGHRGDEPLGFIFMKLLGETRHICNAQVVEVLPAWYHAYTCVCSCVCGCLRAMQENVQKVAWEFESCSESADQYHIVLGNKQWAYSFVNLLKHIINPGALFFPLHSHTSTTSSPHPHVSTHTVTHCGTWCQN